jgi:lipopolysaccharide/colanic/teichoic acid biosynthesis glycosyltransferase
VRVDGGDGSDDLEGAQEEALAGLIHPGASVHPTARLMGPVAVGAGALIGPGALIVGPTAIGDRATICSDAVVAQCFVSAGSFIAPGETIRHCVNTYRETDSPRPPQVRFANTVPARPSSEPTTPFGPRHLEVKAMIDATIASVALVVLAPLLILIAALVKVTSRGPIFYGARREGLHGRPFRCWKFRSMQTDAEVLQKQLAGQQEMDGPQFKMARDPRVTAIGRFLRATNLDELPQLFNVARMQMSIVGPRPSPFGENQICIPWRNARLAVRPGITGLWQICRHDREQGDFHQWIQYDLLYVRNASLFLDFKILVATVLTAGGRHPVAIERIIPSESRPLPAELPKRPHAEPLAPLYRNTPGSVPVVQSTQ